MKTLSRIGLVVVLIASTAYALSVKREVQPMHFPAGVFIGSASATTANKVTKSLGASATIDFTASTNAPVESSGITVTGAAAGDACSVGTTAAAGALNAAFTCYVSAANTVKVKFFPRDVSSGTITLSGGTGTATVSAGSTCVCTDTTANASVKCAVASTTLTATGTTTDVIAYSCASSVDPASGTFYVRVTSSQ